MPTLNNLRAGALLSCLLAMGGCASPGMRSPPPGVLAAVPAPAVLPLPGAALEMESAVRLALLNNKHLRAVYGELDIANAELAQAGLAENPTLGLEYLTGGGVYFVSATLMQPLISLITMKARRQLGGTQAQIRSFEVRHVATELAADVKAAYTMALADARLTELAEDATLAGEAAADLAARQYSAGTASRRDQTQQQIAYAQAALETAQLQARSSEHRERLNRLLSLWGPSSDWVLPATALSLPTVPLVVGEVEGTAIGNRADLAAALRDTELRYRQLGLAQDTRWLQSLGLGFVFERDTDGALSRGPHLEVGVPLFDRGQASLARAQADLTRSEMRLEALAIDIRSQAREAAARVRATHAFASHLQNAILPLHTTLLAETQKHYNGMLVGIYDLLLARQQQLQAARQSIEAIRDYWLAVVELERVSGGALPPATPIAATASPPQPSPATPTAQDAVSPPQHEHHGDKP